MFNKYLQFGLLIAIGSGLALFLQKNNNYIFGIGVGFLIVVIGVIKQLRSHKH